MRKLKVLKGILLFWCLFIGLGAMVGGVSMLIAPDGSILHMQAMLPYFAVLPFSDVLFQDYIFSGIMLIIVNGISNLIASFLLIKNKKAGFVLGTIFGFTLMLWIMIQFIIFPPNILDNCYFTFGVLQLFFGYNALVCFNQVNFKFDEAAYKNISKKSKTLTVYFSRMKYTKRIAYMTADREGSEITELKTDEMTEGTLGFWWCGRFGMHMWQMKTRDLEVSLSDYDRIIIVTPIWVFRMCAPVRDFIIRNKDVLLQKKVDVVFNHFNPWLPKGAVNEVKKYITVNSIDSWTTMLGHTFGLL